MVSRDRSGKERDLKSREPTKKGFATQLSSNVPSMISISSLSVLPSLTVMTPSLPTFFMASLLREFIMTEINKNTTNKILHGLTVNKILIINLLSYWELRHKLIKNYFYKLKYSFRWNSFLISSPTVVSPFAEIVATWNKIFHFQ